MLIKELKPNFKILGPKYGSIINDVSNVIKAFSQEQIEDLERDGTEQHLSDVDGIVVPGGFGKRGVEGMILAADDGEGGVKVLTTEGDILSGSRVR